MAHSAPGVLVTLVDSLVRRRQVLLAGLVLAALAWLGSQAWHAARGPLKTDSRYLVSADEIVLTPAPAWVMGDLREHAVARASVQSPLSMLEPEQLTPRLAEAFRLEPWVRQVLRVQLLPPRGVKVDLEWRQPYAAAETRSGDRATLLLLDAEAVRLPCEGLPQAMVRRLPRIAPVYNAPPEGEAWTDRQVLGALSLIARLGDDWSRLSLADVTPSARPEIRGQQQFYSFQLTSVGGTQIVWGAAPEVPAADEAPFEQKLSRLKEFLTTSGARLDSHRSPQSIDLRYGLQTVKRIAKKDSDQRTAQRDNAAEADEEIVK